MDYYSTYNPVKKLSAFERMRNWAWASYGVDAGQMVGTMVAAFAAVVVLGVVAVAQM